MSEYHAYGCEWCDRCAEETGGVVAFCLMHQGCTHVNHSARGGPFCCSKCEIHVTPHRGCFLR